MLMPVEDVVDVSVAGHTCALRRSGTVVCWGSDVYGQMGLGRRSDAHALVEVAGVRDAVRVETGRFHTVAVTRDGHLYSWGYESIHSGSEGRSRRGRYLRPALVPGFDDVVDAAADEQFTCVIPRNGAVRCLGAGADAWCESSCEHTPGTIPGTTGLLSLTCGSSRQCCGLASSGAIACWGFLVATPLARGVISTTVETDTRWSLLRATEGGPTARPEGGR